MHGRKNWFWERFGDIYKNGGRWRTYTETQFPHARKKNIGQRNQYLIEDAHVPIITHEETDAAVLSAGRKYT